MDLLIEVLANTAFIVGFFFGPALALEGYRIWRATR